MPQMVWTARPDGYLDYYNDRWYEYTGLPRGVGGDESWKSVLHPDDVKKCMETWYTAVHARAIVTKLNIDLRTRNQAATAGTWDVPCRSRTLQKRSCAGLEPARISTIRNGPRNSCGKRVRTWSDACQRTPPRSVASGTVQSLDLGCAHRSHCDH